MEGYEPTIFTLHMGDAYLKLRQKRFDLFYSMMEGFSPTTQTICPALIELRHRLKQKMEEDLGFEPRKPF